MDDLDEEGSSSGLVSWVKENAELSCPEELEIPSLESGTGIADPEARGPSSGIAAWA